MITDNRWTNDSYEITWLNDDEIVIRDKSNKFCIMDGGDFERVLSGLVTAYQNGLKAAKSS